jgi:hypothetical protein
MLPRVRKFRTHFELKVKSEVDEPSPQLKALCTDLAASIIIAYEYTTLTIMRGTYSSTPSTYNERNDRKGSYEK